MLPRLTPRAAARRSRSARICPWRIFGSRSSLFSFLAIIALISSALFTVFTVIVWLTVARDAQLVGEQMFANATGLRIFGYARQLDLEARELSIIWELSWCTASELSLTIEASTSSPVNCRSLNAMVDVYFNGLPKPALSYDPYAPPSEALCSQDVACFKTEHRIDPGTKRGYAEQLVVPFDSYTFRTSAIAIDPATNRSLNIVQFTVTSPVGSFVVLSRDTDANEPTSNPENSPLASRAGSRVLILEIKRSKISRTVILSLALLNWLLVIGSVYVTALVTSGNMAASNGLALLPFSMLVTIPAVRALYVEPPPLSASIDTAGFFVQLMVVALCELVLLRKLTLQRATFPLDGLV